MNPPPLPIRKGRRGFRDDRGMASLAVYIFSVVSVLILVANFKLNYAVNSTSDAYDTFASETVEKNGIAQIVKESILAVGETAVTASANSFQTEIQNRLGSMNFPSGVTVGLDPNTPVPALPSNAFFPSGTAASASQPDYFAPSADSRALAGMGNLLSSFCMLGPVSDLGRVTLVFDRTSAADPDDNRTYTVNADLFSVPLTNIDVIAYGLPVSGIIPPSAPAVPAGFFGSGVSSLVVTSNNPGNDPTAYSDLFASSGAERLPYQYRNAVSFAWNAYEYLWSSNYQNALLAAANSSGEIYNFEFPPDPDNPVPGVSGSGNSISIDCGAISGSILAIVDPQGTGSVTITGTPNSGNPFVLLIRNTAGAAGQTSVTFSGNNLRPGIFYLENCALSFSGAPQVEGALVLDPTTTASGAVTWFGHFSFYGAASPLSTLSITMADSPEVKSALAPLAPRVLLVSTTAVR